MFEYLKALHIIFVVTWFAGLFYIVRLFIYHLEAQNKTDGEVLIRQFLIMEKRLWYGITWPSCVLTLLLGATLIQQFIPLGNHPWLLVKLCLVALMALYHLSCGHLYQKLKSNQCSYTPTQLRIWNEVATVFLFSIVFLAVLKDSLSSAFALIGLLSLIGVLIGAMILYRKIRSDMNS